MKKSDHDNSVNWGLGSLKYQFGEVSGYDLYYCQKTISTQKIKLLGEVSEYDLYYFLKHPLKWKPFELEICTGPHYLVFNFYQINKDSEIRTHDCLVIKVLIPCQRTILTQKFKSLYEIP